jgi:DNA-binding NarL/FixJ family response regulator
VAPVRTLIVDDDFYARDALRSLLSRDARTRVWGDAGDASEAIAIVDSATSTGEPLPEVVLLDVRLNDDERAGIEALPDLKAHLRDARFLITSVSCDEDTVLAAIRAGGDGYIWKNESAERIAEAVVRSAQGRFVVTPAIAERLAGTVADLIVEAAEVLPERRAVAMTESLRKTVYLYCVCGMSAREIADELQLSVHAVNSRIKTAYQILGASSRREAFERLISAEEQS